MTGTYLTAEQKAEVLDADRLYQVALGRLRSVLEKHLPIGTTLATPLHGSPDHVTTVAGVMVPAPFLLHSARPNRYTPGTVEGFVRSLPDPPLPEVPADGSDAGG